MKNEYELGAYYKDDEDNIIKLVRINTYNSEWFATTYDCRIVREGEYPYLNRNPIVTYMLSAMKKCKKLNDAELLAVVL